MKLLPKLSLITLFCCANYPAVADNIMNSSTDSQNISNNTSQIAGYLLNLGKFLGFDLTTQNAPTPPKNYSAALLNGPFMLVTEQYVFNTFLGAIPVNSLSQALSQFVPTSIAGAQVLNSMSNLTFKGYGGDSGSQQNAIVTASNLIDQSSNQGQGQFLSDPVSQSIFDILGTPDATFCMNNDASAWLKRGDCSILYQDKVMYNVIGSIPTPNTFYSYTYIQSFINQLNSNSLLAPMLYGTDSTSPTQSPIPGSKSSSNTGLTAQNQAQQANNFIRYASGLVAPASLPKYKDYSDLYSQATKNMNVDPPDSQQMQAQATLSSYFNNLRVYAAQSSVGISNLYYILSKRLPQNQSANSDPSKNTSQALSEFNMATWRIFNPNAPAGGNGQTPSQWSEQLNTASSATIQKEIAVLLAEINYQMYLDRQIQERMLLTNTILLMQNLKASQPSPDFASQGTDANSNTGD